MRNNVSYILRESRVSIYARAGKIISIIETNYIERFTAEIKKRIIVAW